MASTYLSDTHVGTGNRRIFTHSFWIKRFSVTGGGGTAQYIFHDGFGYGSGDYDFIAFNDDNIQIGQLNSGATAYAYHLKTTAVYRDLSAWYHIVIAFDTTQATSSDRIKLWVNGEQVTSFGTSTYPSQNFETQVNVGSNPLRIGNSTGSNYLNGALTHYHFIDGTAYDADTFGQFDANGFWKPKTSPSVTYGGRGWFLKFESGSLGADSSGNGNDFAITGTLTQSIDTPSNVFSTFNPTVFMQNKPSFSNGNSYIKGFDANYCEAFSTLSMPKKGKWYAEFRKIQINNCFMVGIGNTNNIIEALRTNTNISPSGGGYSGGAVTIREGGDVRQTNASDISGFFSSSIANTDIIGLAIDLDNGAVYAHKNGTYGVISSVTGDPTSGASKTGAIDISGQAWYQNADFICFLFGNTSNATKDWCQGNWGNGYFGADAVVSGNQDSNGQGIFEYAPPTGYYALCTKNLATYG
jgi:hypothetical protein